jgi:hypothetical protein
VNGREIPSITRAKADVMNEANLQEAGIVVSFRDAVRFGNEAAYLDRKPARETCAAVLEACERRCAASSQGRFQLRF